MAVKIISVQSGSPAQHAGITADCTLLKLNGHEIVDILDYRFYGTDARLAVEYLTPSGEPATVHIRKGQYESIGLEFETYLMDQQHSCRNKCIFCFIDQLPKGMRRASTLKTMIPAFPFCLAITLRSPI